jgi:hypothetical protein
MNQLDRKTAVAAYKERKSAFGVFAVICTATGQVWVGQSSHVDTHANRLWFALKHGTSPHAALRDAWTLHGEDSFKFEELERLRDDYPELGRKDELKRRLALWKARLDAASL